MWSVFLYFLRHRTEYDLIHVHVAHYEAFTAALAGKLLLKPTICKPTGTGAVGNTAAVRRSPISILLPWGLKLVDRFVSVSQMMSQELADLGIKAGQIVMIPNGVDTDWFRSNSSDTKRSEQRPMCLLFVGRLSYEKGPDLLIEAFRAVVARNPQAVRLVLLGEGKLRPVIEEQVRDHVLQKLVEFKGNTFDVRPYLQEADLFLLPSRSEGLSNALLEAMAYGLPVVATRVSGTVDVIQDEVNGLLVEPEDPQAIAQAVQRLLNDAGLAGRLGREARRTVEEKYSLQSVAERYIDLYRELLARRDS